MNITKDLLGTPRLLVVRDDGSAYNNYIEIILLEVTQSGSHMKYRLTAPHSEVPIWTSIDTFKLIEVLENK